MVLTADSGWIQPKGHTWPRPGGAGYSQTGTVGLAWTLEAQESLDPKSHGEVEARLRVLEVDPADLADAVEPVAERVRVHPQLLSRLLLLARLEKGAQRGHQVPFAGGVVLDQGPEMPAAVVDQAFVGHRGEEPGQTQLGHRDHLAPALEAGERLHHGRHLAQGARYACRRLRWPAEAHRDRESRLPFGDRLLHLEAESVGAHLVVAGFGSQREERHHLVGPALDQRARITDPHDTGHAPEELTFEGLDRVLGDLAGAVEAAKVVDVDEHHDVAAVQGVSEVPSTPLGCGLVPICPVEEVLEVLAPDTALDLRQLAFFGHRKRQDQGRLLDRHEGELLVVRRVIEDGDVAEHLAACEYRRDQALSRHAEVREGWNFDGAALGLDLAQHALDLWVEEHALGCALAEDGFLAMRIGAASGMGQKVEARVLYRYGALQEVGQRAADLVDALAVEDQLGEAPVDLDRALEPPVLGVDDPFQQRGHEVDQLHAGRDREQGDVEPIRLSEHLGRQLAQVGHGPHDESDASRIGDTADQADLRLRVVLDREAGGEHEVSRTRQDLGRLHQAHPLDGLVQAVGARDELGAGQDRAHRVAHRRTGLNLGFRGLLGRHGSRL